MRIALVLLALASAPAMAQAADAVDGSKLFRERCGGCHLDRGFGTRILARRVPPEQAMLEKRMDMTADYVKLVVRRGLGSMPMIRKAELDDRKLDAIAGYLGKGDAGEPAGGEAQ